MATLRVNNGRSVTVTIVSLAVGKNTSTRLGVPVLKCNAHRLDSATMWALGISGSKKTCEDPPMEKLIKKLAALVEVFNHSTVNNDELKDIQKLQEGFHKVYEVTRRNDTR